MKCGAISIDIRMNADRTIAMSDETPPWYRNIETPNANESADKAATMAAFLNSGRLANILGNIIARVLATLNFLVLWESG